MSARGESEQSTQDDDPHVAHLDGYDLTLGVFSSLNGAISMAKTIVGLRNTTVVQSEVSKLLPIIVKAHQDALASYEQQSFLLQRNRELEGEVAQLKNWDADKQRYDLKPIKPGRFAYVLKDAMGGAEADHALCAHCFNSGKKEFLQRP